MKNYIVTFSNGDSMAWYASFSKAEVRDAVEPIAQANGTEIDDIDEL